jgi:bifunctional DNase/RNase
VPQSQPALPRRGSSRHALSAALLALWRNVGALWRNLRLTAARVWSKIISGRDGLPRQRLGTRGEGNSASRGSGAGIVRERGGRAKTSIMAARREDFILMIVGGLTLDPTTKMPIVVLKDPDNKLNLPIWIGPLEAASMATELEGIRPQRPMTHDLIRNMLGDLGATVEAVEVTELRENTYFARILVHTRDGRDMEVDSRPSDAIAIALRTKSPIYVAKKVLEMSSELHEQAAEPPNGADQNLASVSRDKWSEILERMSPDDFKYKM